MSLPLTSKDKFIFPISLISSFVTRYGPKGPNVSPDFPFTH